MHLMSHHRRIPRVRRALRQNRVQALKHPVQARIMEVVQHGQKEWATSCKLPRGHGTRASFFPPRHVFVAMIPLRRHRR